MSDRKPRPPSLIDSDTVTRKVASSAVRILPGSGTGTFTDSLATWRASALDPTLPRFKVIGPLGRGSQGLVIEVEDQDCRRQIAIKTLHRRNRSGEERQRFIHEAQITAQLEHPGIVPVHDIGVLADGSVFYAMKRIDGTTLADLLQAEPVLERTPARQIELIQVFSRVCDTMAFAHSREVIHRDLKARNIMIGRFGEVLVLDWGLAKVIGDQTSDTHPTRPVTTDSDPNQTGPGCAVGTPATMSPEQARGHAVSPRSDVYSLGVVLYQILSNCSPYDSNDSLTTIEHAAKGLWVPLDQRPSGHHQAKRLIAIVHRAMAHKPSDRYADAGALGEDIRRYLAGEAVEACRESPVDVLARICSRHRRALGAVALTLMVSATAVAGWQIRNAVVEHQQRAELHRKASQWELSGNFNESRRIFERLIDQDPTDRLAQSGLTHCQDALRRLADTEILAQRRLDADKLRRQAVILTSQPENPDRLAEAQKNCQGALALDPSNPEILRLYEQVTKILNTLEQDAAHRQLETASELKASRLAAEAEEAARAQDFANAKSHLEAAQSLHANPVYNQRLLDILLLIKAQQQRQQRISQLAAADKPLSEVRRLLKDGNGQKAKDALEQVRGIAEDHPDLPALTEQVRQAVEREQEDQARQNLQIGLDAIHDAGDQANVDLEAENCRLLRSQLLDQPSDSLRQKLALAERLLNQHQGQRAALLAKAATQLHQAHTIAPWLIQAKAELGSFYAERLREAESAGDDAAAAAAEAQANTYAVGARSLFLDGMADVRVPADAPGITLSPLVIGPMRTLVPEPETIAIASGDHRRIPHGHWLVRGPEGIQTARRFIRGDTPEIRLPSHGCKHPQLICIPGGLIYASNGRSQQQVTTFLLARREITVGEWLNFLNDPMIMEQYDRALGEGRLILAPRLSYTATQPLWRRQGLMGTGAFLAERQDNTAVNPDLPVSGISAEDALAYLAWRSARDGISWRLPTPAEWTLAVQGGEGRPFPWGWAEDAGLTASAAGAKEAVAVMSFPSDQSAQGVFDLAGSVSEFASPDPGSSLQPLMGGNRFDRDPNRLSAFQRRDLDRRVVHPGAGLRLATNGESEH